MPQYAISAIQALLSQLWVVVWRFQLPIQPKKKRRRVSECVRWAGLPPRRLEEVRLAGKLIDAADGKVDLTAYPDQAAQELKTLIEAELAGQPAETTAARAILPLLGALLQSVQVGNGKGASSPVKEKASRKRPERPVDRASLRRLGRCVAAVAEPGTGSSRQPHPRPSRRVVCVPARPRGGAAARP
jgi:hypothetical protein